MTTCFCAEAAAGPLALLLPGDAADAVDAALLLAAHEPLLAALEQALRQPLDPLPCAEPPAALLWAHDTASGASVGCAWSVLAAMPAAPAWPLAWPALQFEADVAGFDTAPPPPPDGAAALLLPPSFDAAWRVTLQAAEPALQAEAEWRGPGSELLLCAPPELVPPATPARAACRVTLATPLQRALPALLGWEAAGVPWRPDGAAVLHLPGAAPRAGRIAPALAGAAFWPGG